MGNTLRNSLLRPLLLTVTLAASAAAQEPEPGAVPPRLLNAEHLNALMVKSYPDEYKRFGLVSHAAWAVLVNSEGQIDSLRKTISTGVLELDYAARDALDSARFEPGRRNGSPVAMWIEVSVGLHPAQARMIDSVPSPLRITNRAEVLELLRAEHPQSLRDRSIEPSVLVVMEVNDTGTPVELAVVEPACWPDANAAAMTALQTIRFEPAATSPRDGRIAFAMAQFSQETDLLVQGVHDEAPVSARSEVEPGKHRAPRLRNRSAIARALSQRSPVTLAHAGLPGEVTLWVFVDERGQVTRKRIEKSSGYCGYDREAINIADRMRFTPALRNGSPAAAWVSIPIIFSAARQPPSEP